MPADVYIHVKGAPAVWYHFTGISDRAADDNKRFVIIGEGIFDSKSQGSLAEGGKPPRVIATIPTGRVFMTKVSSERIVNKTTGEFENVSQKENNRCTIA